MDFRWIAAAAALPLAACANMDSSAGPGPAAPPASTDVACDADAAQSFIGQIASAETGTAMLRATGARMLRWVAPGMAVTMDYRHDRLTVTYDGDYKIMTISCG